MKITVYSNSPAGEASARHLLFRTVVRSCLATSLLGCSGTGLETDRESSLGTISEAIMTDEPGHKIPGYPGVVRIVQPSGWKCTGWILNERTVITAAHCVLRAVGTNVLGYRIEYPRAEGGMDVILSEATPVTVQAHPNYIGGDTVAGFFANPLLPGEEGAKHDVGFITAPSSWKNTNYKDYLRVYNDEMRTLTSVYSYGFGNIYATTQAVDPNGKLRFSHFDVRPEIFSSDLVINTVAGLSERICKGDSGGPLIKKIDSLSLVAGVNASANMSDDDWCPPSGNTQFGEKLTWAGSDDFSWLRTFGMYCPFFEPSGAGNNYARCFELPFINDAPDLEQEHGGKLSAIAQTIAGVI